MRHRRQPLIPAKRTTVDGIVFASRTEARRYSELKLLERVKVIKDLELQPAYPLVIEGTIIGVYHADFRYVDCVNGEVVVEEVKRFKTREYRRTKKIVEALFPVQIREV